MKPKPTPSAEQLRKLLDYDPETGALTWRERSPDWFIGSKHTPERAAACWNAKMAGKPALASVTANGYGHGAIGNQSFLAHRIIWKMATGEDAEDIDHVNGDRTDNRLANLRSCSRTANMRNRGLSRNNRSGYHGVWMELKTGKWCAQIEHDGIVEDLGRFDVIEDAAAARKAAELRLGFSANHGARSGYAIASASLRS
jgi:hypothetical protein